MIGFKSSLSVKDEKRCTTSVTSSKWRVEVSNLKVGDIVHMGAGKILYRGLVTKINAGQATVLWFGAGKHMRTQFTKVEVGGG